MKPIYKFLLALGVSIYMLVATAFLIGYTSYVQHRAFIEGYQEALKDAGLSKYIKP